MFIITFTVLNIRLHCICSIC